MSSSATKMKAAPIKDGDGGLARKEGDGSESPYNVSEKPRQKPQRQYSREELIELMTHPLSSVKHPCLENPQNKSLVSGKSGVRWLEDRWDHRKHTDSFTDEDRPESSSDPHKKRMNDPKTERLRKEQDVVLSPQRRSFNSGCFVNQPSQSQHGTAAHNRRADSPPNNERDVSHREMPARRIGSGRIIRDPMWDYRNVDKDADSQNSNNHDYNYRQRDDRYERRSYERSHDKDRPQQRNSRYNNNNNERKHNKYEKHEPEEPEWFSGGPTSQHDTIELHGFDGPTEEKTPPPKKQNKNAKNSAKNNKKSTETNKEKTESSGGNKKSTSRKTSPEVTDLPQTRLSAGASLQEKPSDESVKSEQSQKAKDETTTSASTESQTTKTKSGKAEHVFDIEDILNFDSLPPLLSISNGNVGEEAGAGSGSRFSQFFRREDSSPKQQGSERQEGRHAADQDDILNSILNDLTNTSVSIPLDGDTYFAPISPAASSVKDEPKGSSTSLLEMLQRGKNVQGRKITKKPSLKDLEVCGKIHSVEELEARLRQEQGIQQPTEPNVRPSNKEEELAVFRKLMMAKPSSQEQKQPGLPGMSGNFPGQQNVHQGQPGMNPQMQPGMNQQQPGMNQVQGQQQMPIPHDLVLKLLHVQQQQRQQQQQQQQQQEAFAKLLAPPNRFPANNQFNVPPPLPPLSPELQMHINNAQPTKELLQRPEAQNILRRLKRGETTIQHLVEQLKRSGNMQPVHREMIASIIKLHSLHPVLQRVPSPRELVAHTQNILQNALLKKKLEEQKENFRKRQELQSMPGMNPGSLSPINHQPNTTSPTPLAFTPTSVLRKMTAEKDAELVNKQLLMDPQLQQPKQGRAIVKGNGNLAFNMPPPVQPVDMMNLAQFKHQQPVHGQQQRPKQPQPNQQSQQQQHFMMGVNPNTSQQAQQLPSSRPVLGVRNMSSAPIVPPPQQQGMNQSVQQMLMNHSFNQQHNTNFKPELQGLVRAQNHMSRNFTVNSINYNMGACAGTGTDGGSPASPVSNQLARWFSPELLAQARAGKLPDMPPLSPTQNMLSVEELERLQQAVHN